MSSSAPSPQNRPDLPLAVPVQSASVAKTEPKSAGQQQSAPLNSMDDPNFAHLPELKVSDLHFRPQRRTKLPIILFVATCLSTFWVGTTGWEPLKESYIFSYGAMWATVRENWFTGLQYMVAVLAILLTHEMGHFLQTVKHRIPASYPLCIPIPFNAIGTMGAVIGMDGMRADRRQIFDIGIAGPIAGLVVAIPVFWWGIRDLDLSQPPPGDEFQLYIPWIGQLMLEISHPQWADSHWVGLSQLNPYFMAGWVGMLITGLNMLPISQLDGGHTIYALFLKSSYRIARWFLSLTILYVVINLENAVMWTPMLVLVILMGIHHPPTANDNVELGPVRWTIGLVSLVIPFFCFPIEGFR